MVTTQTITNKKDWEDFLAKHPEANFLQSWNWGEFHEAMDHTIHRSGFYLDNKLHGIMLSVVEHAKRGTYLTVPGGPIIDWQNTDLVQTFLEEVKRIAVEEKCAFIRVRPQLESNDFSKSLFKKLGFRFAPMHLHAELTNQLDITKSKEELMTNMRKATRYEIRQALKLGIKTKESKETKDIKEFYSLQLETAKRQGFVPFSQKFLSAQFEVFAKDNQAILYSASYEKKLLAMAFVIFYGKEAVYHYGASTPEGRNYPGAYLIQWQAIQEAKKRDILRYNFWGVANGNHRFAHLSMFKRGFGGADVEYLHAQDLVVNWPKYLLNLVVELARKKIRRV